MAFRFVHAADIHLDSPLRSLAMRDPALADLVGNATRRAFSATIDLCLREQVDAFLLSGDLYDGEQTSMKTAVFLANELHRLDVAGIKTFIIRGNHDALSKITKELVLPDGVKVFGGRADVVMLDGCRGPSVAIHGVSFAQPDARESLLPRYRPPVEGVVNVGLMHTSVDGSPSHDRYAPCARTDLEASGFRIWALGHIHARSVSEGPCTIIMPGMPQGRDIGESGPKGVTLVTIHDDGAIALQEQLTSIAQFERVEVETTNINEWPDLIRAIDHALGSARAEVCSEHLVARLMLVGTSPLAWRMRRDGDLVRTEAERRAGLLGKTWIDKVEIHAAAGATNTEQSAGAFDELRRSIMDEIRPSAAYSAAVVAAIEELRQQLPPECRESFGTDADSLLALSRNLAARGCEDVLARLGKPEML